MYEFNTNLRHGEQFCFSKSERKNVTPSSPLQSSKKKSRYFLENFAVPPPKVKNDNINVRHQTREKLAHVIKFGVHVSWTRSKISSVSILPLAAFQDNVDTSAAKRQNLSFFGVTPCRHQKKEYQSSLVESTWWLWQPRASLSLTAVNLALKSTLVEAASVYFDFFHISILVS